MRDSGLISIIDYDFLPLRMFLIYAYSKSYHDMIICLF